MHWSCVQSAQLGTGQLVHVFVGVVREYVEGGHEGRHLFAYRYSPTAQV